MKKAIILAVLLAAACMTISCEKEEVPELYIVGQGPVEKQSLNLEPFSGIELQGVANLYISSGEEQLVNLKAQKNIMEVLTWSVSAEILTIGLKAGVSLHNHEEIRFEIQLPGLDRILHEGVGDIRLQGALQTDLELVHQGVGSIHAYGLPVEHCVLLQSGIGDCFVKVNDYLEVDITGQGNVYYKGTPQISCSESGLGSLINDN
jgi:hypothetical protein